LFQSRRTHHPLRCKVASRRSWSPGRECWPPSTSTIRRASRQAKSTMYGGIGNCRRKRKPSCRCRNSRQSARSASVKLLRNRRARDLIGRPPRMLVRRGITPTPTLPRLRGRERVSGAIVSSSPTRVGCAGRGAGKTPSPASGGGLGRGYWVIPSQTRWRGLQRWRRGRGPPGRPNRRRRRTPAPGGRPGGFRCQFPWS